MKHGYRWLISTLLAVTLLAAIGLIVIGGEGSLAVDGIIYVDADATGLDDGSTWENAFTDLQSALDAAPTLGDEIWVAAGIYTPTLEFFPGDPRSVSFQMKNGIAIYGGFDPSVGDIAWDDRDWVTHETILSGDLHGDDGPDSENNGENSYHVFFHPLGADLDATAILDGFVITGGNANSWVMGDLAGHGGGMDNRSSSPTLSNCIFAGNTSEGFGGGMYNFYNSSPVLTNCAFLENAGGGMANFYYSSPVLIDCSFSGNVVTGGGAGMYNFQFSSPNLINCTFSGNSAYSASSPTFGGGMRNYESSPNLINCTFSGNSADYGGGMRNYESSSPELINCTFSANAADYGGGISNSSSSPKLTNCILWGDTGGEISGPAVATYSDIQGGYEGEGNIDADPLFLEPVNGDYHLEPSSPCIDVGDNNALNLPPSDFEGDSRISDGDGDCVATVDMGVDEVDDAGTCSRVYLPLVLRKIVSAPFEWTELSSATPIGPNACGGIAYDTARDRLVFFGQYGPVGTTVVGTWEFDGVTWQKMETAHQPSYRFNLALAYDEARQKVVAFGGADSAGLGLDETWEYDGSDWTEINTPHAPPGRREIQYGMVYDSARQRMVLFGGCYIGTPCYNDTWEYDGTDWVQIQTPVSPPTRGNHAMVFDSTRNRTVLFSGYHSPSSPTAASALSDMWEYDGSTWTQMSVSPLPPARGWHMVAYDSKRDKIVLFGGHVPESLGVNDTWEFDGTSWQQMNPVVAPANRSAAQMTYVPAYSAVVLLGGRGDPESYSDFWQWAEESE